MDTSGRSGRPRRALSQWDKIRAVRAFYGRPLGYEDLQKIKLARASDARSAAERAASGSKAATPPRAITTQPD